MMVLGMEVLSSAAISVNMTPTTQSSEYQPVTSVSRVDADNTDEIFLRIFPLLSDGRLPRSRSRSTKDFRERSLLFLSREIIRRKASGFKTTRSPLDVSWESALKVTPSLPERRACTMSSADLLLGIEPRGLLIARELRGRSNQEVAEVGFIPWDYRRQMSRTVDSSRCVPRWRCYLPMLPKASSFRLPQGHFSVAVFLLYRFARPTESHRLSGTRGWCPLMATLGENR